MKIFMYSDDTHLPSALLSVCDANVDKLTAIIVKTPVTTDFNESKYLIYTYIQVLMPNNNSVQTLICLYFFRFNLWNLYS